MGSTTASAFASGAATIGCELAMDTSRRSGGQGGRTEQATGEAEARSQNKSLKGSCMTRVQASMVAIVVVAGAAGVAGQNRSQDYSQWRGPNRDGSAVGFVE